MTEQLFVAVRAGDNGFFFDPGTFGHSILQTQRAADEMDKLSPNWASACPVIKIVKATVTAEVGT